MRCPNCERNNSMVIDSRQLENGDVIRRRRECKECKHRYTSYEIVATPTDFEIMLKTSIPTDRRLIVKSIAIDKEVTQFMRNVEKIRSES